MALRPEPLGALVYRFGTRRLSFLKTPQLVEVVLICDEVGFAPLDDTGAQLLFRFIAAAC